MSPTWDTVVTIAVFVVLLLPLFFVIASAPLHVMQADGTNKDSSVLVPVLAIVAVVVPPLLAVAVYVVAVVFAWRADGPTWYYPLIGGVTAGALWFGAIGACGAAIKRLHASERAHRRGGQRPP